MTEKDILNRLRNGEKAEDIAKEFSNLINSANKLKREEDEARKKAEAEAKKQAEAAKIQHEQEEAHKARCRCYLTQAANLLNKYMEETYPNFKMHIPFSTEYLEEMLSEAVDQATSFTKLVDGLRTLEDRLSEFDPNIKSKNLHTPDEILDSFLRNHKLR